MSKLKRKRQQIKRAAFVLDTPEWDVTTAALTELYAGPHIERKPLREEAQ